MYPKWASMQSPWSGSTSPGEVAAAAGGADGGQVRLQVAEFGVGQLAWTVGGHPGPTLADGPHVLGGATPSQAKIARRVAGRGVAGLAALGKVDGSPARDSLAAERVG